MTSSAPAASPGASVRRVPYAALLLVSSLISIAATFAIIVERAILSEDPSHRTSCDFNPWMSCGRVMQSWQAQTFGFPNTYIGVVAFSILICVAMSLFAGARFARWYWLTMNAVMVLGLAFCAWLYYAAVYQITTLCLYCMIVWAMVILQLFLTTSRNLQHGVLPASPRVRTLVRDLTWPAIVLAWAIVFVSLLLRFGPGMLGL
ncbi:vitamin K epoxide reductase family protein [Micrococcus cohnii]|uniref:Putative membrane protein n=1 Tax=Micrococcus cohnii TaxID=993416 RepID=A0A7W7M2T0_9MICC|nr:vitamin K epoxide reductase family protein [Micrococcus cohnii]MBB4735105.1 putative membrane protein [Micrococcus cohnii]